MRTLEKNKIVKFRQRLYQKNMPPLLRSGAPNLKPIEKCNVDQQGKIIVSTNDIIIFFFSHCQQEDVLDINQYFFNLYLLFEVLTKKSEDYSFQSDIQVPEKDIQEANDKITIEYLTKNLIIIYFDNIALYNGRDTGNNLLDKNLSEIIKKENEGRDYQTLADKTLENLIEKLKEDAPWRLSLEHIEKAALVCKLAGASLPQIEKNVLSKILVKSRIEIKKLTIFLEKILDIREQLNLQKKRHKEISVVIKKLDAAFTGNLNSIENYLFYAYKFMEIIGASANGFLGQNNQVLKNNLARLFLEFRESTPKSQNPVYSATRHRMAKLFKYPEITRYMRSLQNEEKYRDHYMGLFTLFFNELTRQMNHGFSTPGDKNFKCLENCLSETIRLVEKLDLEKSCLIPKKRSIRQKYLSLLKTIPLEQIFPLLSLKENFCRIIQDDSKELLEDIRKNLVDICYACLLRIGPDFIPEDERCHTVEKVMAGYSQHYQPQRFFYKRFFEKYICNPDNTPSNYLDDLIKTKKSLALAMLDIFSNPSHVGDLLSREQIKFSENILKKFSEK